MLPVVRHLSYEQRLHDLGLMDLDIRRFRADLIETVRVIRGIEGIESGNLFGMGYEFTRGHSHMINKGHFKRYSGALFHTRVISAWNHFPSKAVDCKSINTFMSSLTKDCVRLPMEDYMSL